MTNRRHWFSAAIPISVMTVLLMAVTPVGASPSNSDQEQIDISSMAAAKGITFDEALARHNMREEASRAVEAINLDTQNFAGIYQDDSNGQWRMHVMVANPEAIASEQIQNVLPAGVRFSGSRSSTTMAS